MKDEKNPMIIFKNIKPFQRFHKKKYHITPFHHSHFKFDLRSWPTSESTLITQGILTTILFRSLNILLSVNIKRHLNESRTAE